MIKAIIIDDEFYSRNLLRKSLSAFCENVVIIGEASGVSSGIELLKKEQPDIILLDIELADGNGFEILNAFDYILPNVIFLTSSNQYAIKAIKYGALDYLLKPIDQQELQLAIQKLKQTKIRYHELNPELKQFEIKERQLQQIILPARDRHTVIDIQNIIRIEAQGSYVMIYLEGNKSHFVVNSLSYYEELLSSDYFFRIHKSHLINVCKIKSFTLGRSSKVLLKDGSELNVAARRKSTFNQRIKRLGTA